MTLKKNTKTCIWHLFYPLNSRELILWYWFSNPLLSMLIDQIALHFGCNFTLDISSDGLFQEKSNHESRVEYMEFPLQGFWRKGTWKSQGPIKKEVEFMGIL